VRRAPADVHGAVTGSSPDCRAAARRITAERSAYASRHALRFPAWTRGRAARGDRRGAGGARGGDAGRGL